MKKQVVLYSGGPDSYITYRYVKGVHNAERRGEIIPQYFDLGHRYATSELVAVARTVPETRVDRSLIGLGELEQPDGYIWNRNAFLVLMAAKNFDGDGGRIYLSVQRDEQSIPDRTDKFMRQLPYLLDTLGQSNIEVVTPWAISDKTDMVEWYLERFNPEKLMMTTSCYQRTEGLPCGNCPACIRRYIAFSLNGLVEKYAQDPVRSEMARQYRLRADAGEYSEKRTQRIWAALGV